MNAILLDTHVWIWFINGDDELNKPTCKIINAAIQNHAAYISAISLWEMNMLEAKGRILLQLPCSEWINRGLAAARIEIAPLSPEIAIESCHLPNSFHGDPADAMIVATARVERLTLITRDKKILAYSKQKYLSTIEA